MIITLPFMYNNNSVRGELALVSACHIQYYHTHMCVSFNDVIVS